MRMRAGFVLAIACSFVAASMPNPARSETQPSAPRTDFNADGYADLAIGIPREPVVGQPQSGAVEVLYGSSSGLQTGGVQLFDEDDPGIPSRARRYEDFAEALASGDFDGDGYDDLAIGAPDEVEHDGPGGGAVFVVFGSAGGLDLGRTQRWTESEVTGLSRRPHDYFGFALAAADFDLDGRDDLAVGAFNAGIVAALYGTDGGLRLARSHVWIQNQFGSPGDWEFGYTLAAGDLGGDGAPDLAIGATRTSGSGAVVVLFSVTGGLSSDGNRVIDAASLGSTHSIEDYFGSALAIGDFDGKDGADLAIGAEFDRSGQRRTGRVYAVPRSQGELDASQALVLGPRRLGGLVGEAEIGSDLAAADLNGDGMEDLIVGAPGARVGDAKYAGSAAVVPGSEDWLDWASTRVLSADTPGMPGRAAYGDNFAYSLLADDFDGAGAAELAVGTRRAIGEERLAGSVYEVSGALDTPAGREWTQNTPGVPGVPNRLDSFGWALA